MVGGQDSTVAAAGAADRGAAAQARAVRAKARAAARASPPQRVTELGHLSLAGLRTYRAALSAEEDRVSYWRPILQGRVDITRTSLHQQLEAATGELIARYHAEPDSCLSALPTRTPPTPAA